MGKGKIMDESVTGVVCTEAICRISPLGRSCTYYIISVLGADGVSYVPYTAMPGEILEIGQFVKLTDFAK